MKHKFLTKAIVILMAFSMLFPVCSYSLNAAKGNSTSQSTSAKTVKDKRTQKEILKGIEEQLKKDDKFWGKGLKNLKSSDTYDDIAKDIITSIFEHVEDPQNTDWLRLGVNTLKSALNLLASCYGLGGASDALLTSIINFGQNPKSEYELLQDHIDEQFGYMDEHMDEIQDDIAELSNHVDKSTKEIIDAVEDAFDSYKAQEEFLAFMSSSHGNFNYKQFKNYLYGSTSGSQNDYDHTQAYLNAWIESMARGESYETQKEYRDALYKSLVSTSNGDSNINKFYHDYLLSEDFGESSIQRYYYDYLIANLDLVEAEGKNAEYEALKFALDLYTTALYADKCITDCNTQQLVYFYETYGVSPALDARYYYGNGDTDYITYGQLLENSAAIEKRQAKLEIQMAKDIAYIFNLDSSVVLDDGTNTPRIMTDSDQETFGWVQIGQTVYLNKLTDDWCENFCFEKSGFTYEWYSNGNLITSNDGKYYVDGKHSTFEGVVKYKGDLVYSVSFNILDGSSFNGGDGSENDPYVITTADQFRLISKIEDGLSKHYVITDDLYFSGKSISAIGNNKDPFKGTINGNGYTIYDLKVTEKEYSGIFGYISGGTVKNLNVANSTFTVDNTSNEADHEKHYAGSIAGVNEGTILNCYVSGNTVKIKESSNLKNKNLYVYCGGIVGYNSGDVSYCKVENTKITAELTRDYGSEDDGNNQSFVYASGVAGAMASNGSMISFCSVNSTTKINASASSYCSAGWSNRKPYIKVRAAGIVESCSLLNVRNVLSEATIEKCEYFRENTGFLGTSTTGNCSSNKYNYSYVPFPLTDSLIKAKEPISFPSQSTSYNITYKFVKYDEGKKCYVDGDYDAKNNCYKDQLYYCCEKDAKLSGLRILVNGQVVEHTLLSYYNFDTYNSDVNNSTRKEITVVFSAIYNDIEIIEILQLPIIIEKNKATGIEISSTPDKLTYDMNEVVSDTSILSGGIFLLRYQDGSTKDVSASVKPSYDLSKYGNTQIIVSYGEFTASYDITVLCTHNYSAETIAPTCTLTGYTKYTCSICEDTYSSNYVGTISHVKEYSGEREATCTEGGKEADLICSLCLKIFEFGNSTPPKGHDYKNGTKDEFNHFCSRCGEDEVHLLKTTEYETEVKCNCIICGHTTSFDVNSREAIDKLPRVVVSDAYSLSGENEVVVYIELYSKHYGITGAYFSVYFGEELELVSYSLGNILNTPQAKAFQEYDDHLNVFLAGAATQYTNQDKEAPNTLLKLVFKTPKDAISGNEYPVLVVNTFRPDLSGNLKIDKFLGSSGGSLKTESLDFISINGSVKIVNRLPGDVVGDGSIDLLDAAIISKYYVLEGKDITEFIEEMKATYPNFDISNGDVTLGQGSPTENVVQILRYIVGGYEARILSKEFFKIKLNYNDGTGRVDSISVQFDDKGNIILNDLPVIEREGYKFDGWYYDFGAYSKEYKDKYEWQEDAIEQTLYAHYSLNVITFNSNGATAGEMEKINSHQASEWIVENNFSKTSNVYFDFGYDGGEIREVTIIHKFEGWALKSDATIGDVVYKIGDVIDLKHSAMGNVTLYAVWSIEYVTLPELNREGYAFTQWTLNGSTVVVGNAGSSYPIIEDIRLCALWNRYNQFHKVTLNANGGSVDTSSIFVVYGYNYDAITELPTPTRDGYTFKGWATSDGTIVNGDSTVTIADNHTLTAQWQAKNYQVTFDANGGSCNISYILVKYGSRYDYLESLPTPTRTGYTFDGWQLSDGTIVTNYSTVTTAQDHTLTAKWTAINYTVSYDLGKEVGGGLIIHPASKATYSGHNAVIYYDPSLDQLYGFYNTDTHDPHVQIGSGVNLEKGKTYYVHMNIDSSTGISIQMFYAINGAYTEAKSIRFTSRDSILTITAPETGYYNIRIDNDCGSTAYIRQFWILEADTRSVTDTYGTKYDKLPTPVIPMYYIFDGWYYNGTRVTSETNLLAASDHTLVAKWTPKVYKVTLEANGGSCSETSINVQFDSQYNSLPTPTRTGYTFDGWQLSDGTIVTNNSTVTTAKEHTLTAKWTANVYKVTLNANGGSCSKSSITVQYGSQYNYLESLPTPTRTGYRCIWYLDDTEVKSTTTVKTAGNHTLVARWTKSSASACWTWDKVTIDDDLVAENSERRTFTTGLNTQELIKAGCTQVSITIRVRGERYAAFWPRNNPAVVVQGYGTVYMGRFGKDTSTHEKTITVSLSSFSVDYLVFDFIAVTDTPEKGGDAWQLHQVDINISVS